MGCNKEMPYLHSKAKLHTSDALSIKRGFAVIKLPIPNCKNTNQKDNIKGSKDGTQDEHTGKKDDSFAGGGRKEQATHRPIPDMLGSSPRV